MKIFDSGNAQEVGKGLQEGNEVVAVDMRGPAMKELEHNGSLPSIPTCNLTVIS